MLVLSLPAIGAASVPIAGGKAANLGEMSRAALPVPPGFCVTTTAYDQVATAVGLAPVVAELAALGPEHSQRLAQLAETLRSRLLAAPIPEPLRGAVSTAYQRLGEEPAAVAVRSSATAEDLPHASFAGQQDTYLHVVGIDAVCDAVRRCWASLWNERAVIYRSGQHIDHRTVRLAVVVQRMVQAEAAGVLFTANPVTGQRCHIVIDASYGLGEAVVSGLVNPDHFVVEQGAIRERHLGDKRVAIQQAPNGGVIQVALPDGRATACLNDQQVVALADVGRSVEEHYADRDR